MPNKIPFEAAVETTQDGRPMKIQLRRVRGFLQREITRYAKSSLAPGSDVISDGLWCFKGVTEAAHTHSAIVTGGGRKSTQLSCFKWVNTMLGNVKNSLLGSPHWYQSQESISPAFMACLRPTVNIVCW